MAIRKCDCKHDYQDRVYGKGMRVMNPTRKGGGDKKADRCTVCLKEHG